MTGVYVVNEVSADNGARLVAQKVNAAHVGKQTVAQVIDVVLFNDIVAAHRGLVTPDPAHRNSAVEQVVNVVVGNGVFKGVHEQYAAACKIFPAAERDFVVGNFVSVCKVKCFAFRVCTVDFNAACAAVVERVA